MLRNRRRRQEAAGSGRRRGAVRLGLEVLGDFRVAIQAAQIVQEAAHRARRKKTALHFSHTAHRRVAARQETADGLASHEAKQLTPAGWRADVHGTAGHARHSANLQ